VGIVAGMPVGALSLIFVVQILELMLAADLGTVQRMPRAVANRSWFNEMMYTGWCRSALFKLEEILNG
jgi:hypothetical protein